MLDIILTNGMIVDGSGGPAYPGSVGIKDGRIAVLGDLTGMEAGQSIDVAGLTIAPGFIDQHTHSDIPLLADGRAVSQVSQGVTLEVVGQCGYSAAPCSSAQVVRDRMIGYHPSVEVTWRGFDQYLDRLSAQPLGLNVAAMVGHGALRLAAKEVPAGKSSPAEIDRMVGLLEKSCAAGALGLSLGLEYEPGISANMTELERLAAVLAPLRLPVTSHIRNRDLYYDHAVTEMCALARSSGASVIISHVNPKFGAPDGAMADILQTVLATRGGPAPVYMDLMPDVWAHTSMPAILPTWAFENGISGILELLDSTEARERIKKDLKPLWQLVLQNKWDRIYLLHSEQSAEYVGSSFAQISQDRNKAAVDCMLDILQNEGLGMANLLWTAKNFEEEDIVTALKDPQCGVISDARTHSPDGVLGSRGGALPTYGWAVRFLERYVRDLKVLPLEDAVRRLTMLPATRLRIADRGRLAPGMRADVTVFDPATVASTVTFANPTSPPRGVNHVLVNGQPVIKDSKPTGQLPGMVVRHS